VESTLEDRIKQFVIDGEAVVLRVDGTAHSHGFRTSDAELGRSVERSVERSYYPLGALRHLLAVLVSSDRLTFCGSPDADLDRSNQQSSPVRLPGLQTDSEMRKA